MGRTIVLCAASETLTGLVSYAIFNVTVKDTLPPEFEVPNDILKDADDIQGTRITYDANASDTIDGNTIPICNPPSGSIFPLGTNYVTCTATDKSGNLGKSSFSVIIKTPKRSISNTETGNSRVLQNLTTQQQLSEFKVSDNITKVPQPTPLSIENETEPSPPNLSEELLNMFKILIEDLK
jgi:HYR domain